MFARTRGLAVTVLLCLFLPACHLVPAFPSAPALPAAVAARGLPTVALLSTRTPSTTVGVSPGALPFYLAGPVRRGSAAANPPAEPYATPVYSYRVVHTYPHDSQAFTQGLVYTNSVLYEGTGLSGLSSLRRVDLQTGEVLQIKPVPAPYFGEGIAVYSDTIVQLTWQSHVAFVYDRDTFSQTGTFTYTGEGWGLTYDGQRLIMSDGSSTLYFRDPQTFSETGRVQVHDGATPVSRLNELEYIGGEVYANVWLTNRIARVDPQTGQVTAWIDLTGLRPPGTDVLNGIAYDSTNGRLFVTGKRWPYLYEIELYLPWRFCMPLVLKGVPGNPLPTPTPVP